MHPFAHKEGGGSQSLSLVGLGDLEGGASESLVHDIVIVGDQLHAAGAEIHFSCIRFALFCSRTVSAHAPQPVVGPGFFSALITRHHTAIGGEGGVQSVWSDHPKATQFVTGIAHSRIVSFYPTVVLVITRLANDTERGQRQPRSQMVCHPGHRVPLRSNRTHVCNHHVGGGELNMWAERASVGRRQV